ncbi:hypothetical protein [Calidifontibacter indicus]|uniref:hypothetical protein n=1 Tax=Calidifontibacter indicus TaxID=419650 RepID=UPI003D7483A9
MRVSKILAVLSTLSVLAGCATAEQPAPESRMSPSARSAQSSQSTVVGNQSVPVPAAASMVCGPEIGESLQRQLRLGHEPEGASTWDGKQFVCTFRLPDGPLVLVVLAHGSQAAAAQSLATQRSQLAGARPIIGLAAFGLPAAQADSGVVLFARDAFTLRVDSTRMTPLIGPFERSRRDFAYSIAADVIACWQEHH